MSTGIKKGIKDYRIARGEDGLKDTLHAIWKETNEGKVAENKQYDILYTVGNLVTLIKASITGKNLQLWHEDFGSRPAPVTVRNVIEGFVKEVAKDNIIFDRLIEPGYSEYIKKQKEAGFFSGGKVNLESNRTTIDNPPIEEIESLEKQLEQKKVFLTHQTVILLLNSQRKLDALSPAGVYAAGGKHKVTLFSDSNAPPTDSGLNVKQSPESTKESTKKNR